MCFFTRLVLLFTGHCQEEDPYRGCDIDDDGSGEPKSKAPRTTAGGAASSSGQRVFKKSLKTNKDKCNIDLSSDEGEE